MLSSAMRDSNSVTMMDSKEAIAALGEIEVITRRVKQSKFYRISSIMLVLWGVLTALGDVITFMVRRRVRPPSAQQEAKSKELSPYATSCARRSTAPFRASN
jgi:hypothetical protein